MKKKNNLCIKDDEKKERKQTKRDKYKKNKHPMPGTVKLI